MLLIGSHHRVPENFNSRTSTEKKNHSKTFEQLCCVANVEFFQVKLSMYNVSSCEGHLSFKFWRVWAFMGIYCPLLTQCVVTSVPPLPKVLEV